MPKSFKVMVLVLVQIEVLDSSHRSSNSRVIVVIFCSTNRNTSTSMNNNSPKPLLGSSKYPFKLCIVGSGPAGCSLIVRAIRLGIIIIIIVILIIIMIIITGVIGDLLSGNSDEGGVCMIDKDGTTSSLCYPWHQYYYY